MIKKIALILLMSLFIYQTTPKQQDKEYTVHATLNEWIVITSHPDDVAKNVRDKVLNKIAEQIKIQLSDTTKKK